MAEHYTDEDVQRALTAALGVEPDSDLTSFTIDRADMRDALDAVAAAIAARALREFSDEVNGWTQEAAGQVREHWRGQEFVDGQDTGYERVVETMLKRADEIEGR